VTELRRLRCRDSADVRPHASPRAATPVALRRADYLIATARSFAALPATPLAAARRIRRYNSADVLPRTSPEAARMAPAAWTLHGHGPRRSNASSYSFTLKMLAVAASALVIMMWSASSASSAPTNPTKLGPEIDPHLLQEASGQPSPREPRRASAGLGPGADAREDYDYDYAQAGGNDYDYGHEGGGDEDYDYDYVGRSL